MGDSSMSGDPNEFRRYLCKKLVQDQSDWTHPEVFCSSVQRYIADGLVNESIIQQSERDRILPYCAYGVLLLADFCSGKGFLEQNIRLWHVQKKGRYTQTVWQKALSDLTKYIFENSVLVETDSKRVNYLEVYQRRFHEDKELSKVWPNGVAIAKSIKKAEESGALKPIVDDEDVLAGWRPVSFEDLTNLDEEMDEELQQFVDEISELYIEQKQQTINELQEQFNSTYGMIAEEKSEIKDELTLEELQLSYNKIEVFVTRIEEKRVKIKEAKKQFEKTIEVLGGEVLDKQQGRIRRLEQQEEQLFNCVDEQFRKELTELDVQIGRRITSCWEELVKYLKEGKDMLRQYNKKLSEVSTDEQSKRPQFKYVCDEMVKKYTQKPSAVILIDVSNLRTQLDKDWKCHNGKINRTEERLGGLVRKTSIKLSDAQNQQIKQLKTDIKGQISSFNSESKRIESSLREEYRANAPKIIDRKIID